MCKFFKKLFKFLAVVAAIAGAVAGVYYAVKKFKDKKEASEEDFVPCECCDCDACCETEETPAESAE
ncbi:MAG: hypothetical protein PUB99_03045 [Oscillospiraceae bacterium]|nr:hypothetical protein [Oscillospiraceae bacterium]